MTRRAPATPERPYYRAARDLVVPSTGPRPKRYKKGQVVPEAKAWPRVESWVNARYLERVD